MSTIPMSPRPPAPNPPGKKESAGELQAPAPPEKNRRLTTFHRAPRPSTYRGGNHETIKPLREARLGSL